MRTLKVGLAGTRGWGVVHLGDLAILAQQGRIELVGVADPAGADPKVPAGVPCYASVSELLAAQSLDVMILVTPINTHAELAEKCLRAGVAVYLEKPPVESLSSYQRLLALSAEVGLPVQVGFQAAGSHALPRIAEIMAGGEIGEISLITALGLWTRDKAYYARAPWAGRRHLDGQVVADGVVTNPLAHAVALALHFAGAERLSDLSSVTTELYRAHDIEADDTSFVAIDSQIPVRCALSVATGVNQLPLVTVHGDLGQLTFSYGDDVVTVATGSDPATGTRTETFGRTNLIANLCDHITDGTDLLSPLEQSAGFMGVLQAIQDAPDPTPIDTSFVTWRGENLSAHPVIDDIGSLITNAVQHPDGQPGKAFQAGRGFQPGRGFAAAGAPWASEATVTRWTPESYLSS